MHALKSPSQRSRQSKSILVTGAAGAIGSHICRSLLEEGHTVYAVDNFITGTRAHIDPLLGNERFVFYEIDIAHPAFVALFDTNIIEYIYHLACPTGVPNLRTYATEMLITCSYGMFNVLEVARKHHSKVVFSSTAEVYGQPEKFPQDELYSGNVNPLGERSAYEEGKRFAESVLAMYVRKHGLDARVVRVFNTYGPGMTLEDQRVIPQFLKCIDRGEPLRIYGDGSQTRSHLYIDDLVAGLEIVMLKGRPGEAYNIGSEYALSVRKLAELLIALTGHQYGIENEPHFIEDHRHRLPSVEKVKQLGWRQRVTIEDGLKRMIAAYLLPAHAKKQKSADLLSPTTVT
jgi:UDP-glucuronate decarboxylase